jgi:aminomethyltransferase
MCQDDGGIIDDVFVYRLEAERFLVVNNASNADTGRERIASFVQPAMNVETASPETVMLALQGPDARSVFREVLDIDVVNKLPRRRCVEVPYEATTLLVSRTGYTGEDGYELVTSGRAGHVLLERLVALGVAPCGLGARDTLRLEAALPLYGNDIDATTNPYEAGLGFAVSLDGGSGFAGRDALAAARNGVARKLACLRATGRGVMRAAYVVLRGGKPVASMTSGSFSPMLDTSIGMAYLPLDLASEGTEFEVDVRGRTLPAVVVPRPFYRRPASSPGSQS